MVAMKMSINKRIKRIFLQHKATYIGMLILIILSTSTFLGLKTASTSIKKNVQDNRIDQSLEDANFFYSKKLSQKEIKDYEKNYNLILEENIYMETEYNKATLRIRQKSETINEPVLYEGEELKNPNDIMVDRYFFEAQNLSFGDKLIIDRTEYTVCGIFVTPDYLTVKKNDADFMCDGTKFGLCMIDKTTFNNIDKKNIKTYYSVIFKENNEEKFRKELGKNGIVLEWTDKDTNSRISTFDGEIESLIMVSKVVPLFILILSSIIMAVVNGRMLKKEYVYIGTLMSMGYTKWEVVKHYMRLPLYLSITGTVIGGITGIATTRLFSVISSVEYNIPKPVYHFNIMDVVFLITVPTLLNYFATLISLREGMNLNIVSLLKANAGKMKKGRLTKLIPHKKGSFKLRFKLKEITSNLSRSFLMFVGIVAASIFMLTGFSFDSSLQFLFNSNFHELFGYEYQYVLKEPLYENNTGGEPYMISSFQYRKNGEIFSLSLNGVTRNSKYIKLYDKDENAIGEDKVVITSAVAKRLNLKKGDTIKIKNNSNLKDYDITIDDVCNIQYSDNIYLPMDKLNEMLDIPKNTYIGLYSDEELNIDSNKVMNVLTAKDSKAGLETSIAAFKVFLYIMAVVSAIIGVIVVYIVTSMLVEENRKNISMLKVVGYHNKEISKLILNSTSVLVWLGFLVAIPLTNSIIQQFFDSLTSNMYFDFIAKLETSQIIIALAIILLVYYVTLGICKKKVLKVNMAESLKARD